MYSDGHGLLRGNGDDAAALTAHDTEYRFEHAQATYATTAS